MPDESAVCETSAGRENETRQLSPVTLAFVGDAVYSLLTREYLLGQGVTNAAILHRKTASIVSAKAQASSVERLLPQLSDEEKDVLRRGRNANTSHVPKNADLLDYRHATGLEALFGYLHLCGRKERLRELFLIAVNQPARSAT